MAIIKSSKVKSLFLEQLSNTIAMKGKCGKIVQKLATMEAQTL